MKNRWFKELESNIEQPTEGAEQAPQPAKKVMEHLFGPREGRMGRLLWGVPQNLVQAPPS